jgi:8-oxo-dGTP pyrophosphatase MutT (NUDIX family)
MSWRDRFKVVPAVYIILERDNKILLLRRFNTGYEDGNYTMPSGHLDGGESATTAAVREAMEEAGVTIKSQDLELAHAMYYLAKEGDHERVAGEPTNTEPHKADDFGWFSYDKLPKNIVWEAGRALDNIKKGIVYSEQNFDL